MQVQSVKKLLTDLDQKNNNKIKIEPKNFWAQFFLIYETKIASTKKFFR